MTCNTGLAVKRSVHRALSRPSIKTGFSFARTRVADLIPSTLPSQIHCSLSIGGGGRSGELSRRWSSSTSSLFDISEYLLSGCSWKHAPSLPDFVGPLVIKPTHDCRGRGLFSAGSVAAGDILLVSNPFALSYNDSSSIHLYNIITSMARQSAKALYQLSSLSGYRDELVVPAVELFHPNADICNSELLEMPDFDPQRIVYVMNTNCFGGEVKFSESEPASQLNGLWLLPSFINHCCTPNACRIFVGEALLILATTDIKAGEEVTISYTDCLLPVHMREAQLESLGCAFFCECKRCVLERSLQEHLLDISETFEQLHEKAADEVFSLNEKKCGCTKPSLSACQELGKMFNVLLKRLESSFDSVTHLQKQWIQASYSYGFLAKCFAEHLSIGHDFSRCVTSVALDLVNSMRSIAPGMKRTLAFTMILATIAKQQCSDIQLIQKLNNLATDECIRVYGKQTPDVTQKLMEQSLDSIPYI